MGKPYSDSRWWDDPKPISSLCGDCVHWHDFDKCDKYKTKVPKEIIDKSFPGTENFDENYCPHRKEKGVSGNC